MKESICEFAKESEVRNEQWQRHAAVCGDCREVLRTIEWMRTLAATTSQHSDTPAPGYLVFKARLQARVSDVDRAALPVNVMAIAAGIFLIVATAISVGFGGETRFGSIMVEALFLLSTYVTVILFAVVLVIGICGTVVYLSDSKTVKGNKL